MHPSCRFPPSIASSSRQHLTNEGSHADPRSHPSPARRQQTTTRSPTLGVRLPIVRGLPLFKAPALNSRITFAIFFCLADIFLTSSRLHPTIPSCVPFFCGGYRAPSFQSTHTRLAVQVM
jgi:hypothetical protein